MTRAEIEAMLRDLAETTQYLRMSSRRCREVLYRISDVAEDLKEISIRTEATIKAALTHLHGDEETDADDAP
jgi:hypothetical protein